MAESQLACSESSAAAGEPLAGSASAAPLFAALSWPKSSWHADKIALSEGLPAALGELAKRVGKRLQLRLMQREGSASTERLELVCVDFATGRSAHARGVPAGEAAGFIDSFLAGDSPAPALGEPLALVCTDGKHDRCCGKLGRSLVAALRGALDVVEASHLGGHRLAPNCLVLPTGRAYGRVGAADAAALIEAVRHDRVYLPCYRGRSGWPELEQVAEAAALARFPDAQRIEVTPAAAGATVSLERNGARAVLDVRCERRSFATFNSCLDAEPETLTRWVAQAL
jgi:hypothetical protein